MKSSITTPRSFCPSHSKLFPELHKKQPSKIIRNFFQNTTDSSIWNDNLQVDCQNQGVFTVDAIITTKPEKSSSKLISDHRENLQKRNRDIKIQLKSLLQTQSGKQCYNFFVQKERERKIDQRFRSILKEEKQKFQQKVRAYSVNKYRINLDTKTKQNKAKKFQQNKRIASTIKQKINRGLMEAISRKQQSFEEIKSRKREIFESQIKLKDKRFKLQNLRRNRAMTNLEERICRLDQQTRKANDQIEKLKQKETKLQKKNILLVDQFHKALDAIKKLQY